MSFDLLPAHLILKVFHQLPFKDRFILGGVNRSFRNTSEESINRMKSLDVTDFLVTYSIMQQSFSSILESSQSTLESIDFSDGSCNKCLIIALTEFDYPKLERLKITVNPVNNGRVKSLISRCPNLLSIVLNTNCQLEWPENVVYEKMENLEIHISRSSIVRHEIDLSPTLRPLIGNIPSLKRLSIERASDEWMTVTGSRLNLSLPEFSQLMASTPFLEELDLDLSPTSSNACDDFKTAMSTWYLPNLTTLQINFHHLTCYKCSIFHHFPASFPRLESFGSGSIDKIDDQAIQALSQLEHLREFHVMMSMKKAQIIDIINRVPSILTLGIRHIWNVYTVTDLMDFLESTADVIRRDVEIDVYMELEMFSPYILENFLDKMKDKGGPVVCYENREALDGMDMTYTKSIRYRAI